MCRENVALGTDAVVALVPRVSCLCHSIGNSVGSAGTYGVANMNPGAGMWVCAELQQYKDLGTGTLTLVAPVSLVSVLTEQNPGEKVCVKLSQL